MPTSDRYTYHDPRGKTTEHDVAAARATYEELCQFEIRVETACKPLYNRGPWMQVLGHLRKAREDLQLFIGKRLTEDLDQRYEQALLEAQYDGDEEEDSH